MFFFAFFSLLRAPLFSFHVHGLAPPDAASVPLLGAAAPPLPKPLPAATPAAPPAVTGAARAAPAGSSPRRCRPSKQHASAARGREPQHPAKSSAAAVA